MIIRYSLLIGALLAAALLPAQTLIPWLDNNGLYGLATEEGKVVVAPAYQHAGLMPENAFFTKAKKDGQEGTLFRSGHFFPLPNRTAAAFVFSENKTVDTLRHLTLTITSDKWVFIDSKTGKTSEYEHGKNYQTPAWFQETSPYTEDKYDYLSNANFHLGVHRVFKPGNRVNFIDTILREIFPGEYAAGLLLSRNRFLLAGDDRKMGIGDRQGNILIPLVWDNIQKTGSEDLFIVKNAQGNAGLIHISGRLVLDTDYREIADMGNNLLRVASGENQAVMDYEGNTVLPMVYADISRTFGPYFIVRKQGGNKLMLADSRGEVPFPVPYEQFTPVVHYVDKHTYLHFRDGQLSGLVDTALNVLFKDSIGNLIPVGYLKNKQSIHFTGNIGGRPDKQGVIDLSGRRIVPFAYSGIQRLDLLEEDLYMVRKDTLWGAYDVEGQLVLPVEFQEISASSDSLVWARRPSEKLYSAYSASGKKRPHPASAFPALDNKRLLFPKSPQFFNGKRMYGLSDGTIIPEAAAQPYLHYTQYPVPDGGGILLGGSGEELQAVDAGLRPIIPEGYRLPSKYLNKDALKNSGLLNVCRGGTPGQPEACGLINARGEWMMSPKEGVWFHPLSAGMILEIPLKYRLSRDYLYPEPLALHLPGGEKMDVHYIGDFYFGENAMLIGIAEAGGRKGRYAYFDHQGKQLTEFDIAKGPAGLRERNLVLLRKPDAQETYAILDARGQILTELEGISEAEIPNGESLSYFTAKERASGLMGVVDSLGKTVLPFQFRDLRINAPGRLLSCLDENGATQLLGWKGNVLYTANGKKDFWVVAPPNGYLLVAIKNEDLTVVIDPEDRFLHTLPYTLTNYARPERPDEAHLALFQSRALGKNVWVDFVKGEGYRAR